MKSTRQSHSPETRRRANASLRLLTRIAALAATGATVAIGVVVAKEHPGGHVQCCCDTVPDHVGNDHLGPEHFDNGHVTTHHHAHLSRTKARHCLGSADDDHVATYDDNDIASHHHDNTAGRHLWGHKAMSSSVTSRQNTPPPNDPSAPWARRPPSSSRLART